MKVSYPHRVNRFKNHYQKRSKMQSNIANLPDDSCKNKQEEITKLQKEVDSQSC